MSQMMIAVLAGLPLEGLLLDREALPRSLCLAEPGVQDQRLRWLVRLSAQKQTIRRSRSHQTCRTRLRPHERLSHPKALREYSPSY